MWKRVIFLLVSLAVLVGMGLFTSAAIAGKQTTAVPYTPINNTNGIYFSAIKGGWFDAVAKYNNLLAEKIKNLRDQGRSIGEAELRERSKTHEKSKFDYKMSTEQTRSAIYRLGITMAPDDTLRFNGVGCLRFELLLGDGTTTTVVDQGVILPYEYPPTQDWLDTRKNNPALFTAAFNDGKLGNLPNFVYVLLPSWTMNATVKQVQPTDKLQIISPNHLAVFK